MKTVSKHNGKTVKSTNYKPIRKLNSNSMKRLYKICYEASFGYGHEYVAASCVAKAVSVFIQNYNYAITCIIFKGRILI